MLLRTFSVALLMLAAYCCAAAAAEIDPAQAIAQKFSEAGDAKPDAKPAQPAIAVPLKPATTTTTAERPSLDYEMDMLRRARAEELDRESQDAAVAKKTADTKKAAAAPKPEEAPKAVEAVAAPLPPVAPVVAPPAATAPIAAAPPPAPAPTVATTVVATPAVTPPATARATQSAEATAIPSAQPPPQSTPAALTAAELPGIASADTSNAPHATVLLVLDTDDAAPMKPDPIICLADRCWISNGIEAAAKPLPRTEAVAMKSTDSPEIDSCSGKSACVFRDVAVTADAQLEVVELGDAHGTTTGGAYTVVTDKSCRKDDGALVCDNALVTHDFRIWMVPEAMAKEIGVEGLEDAVAAGLPNDGVEPANDK